MIYDFGNLILDLSYSALRTILFQGISVIIVVILNQNIYANDLKQVKAEFDLTRLNSLTGQVEFQLQTSSTEIGFCVLLLEGTVLSDLNFSISQNALVHEVTAQTNELIEGTISLDNNFDEQIILTSNYSIINKSNSQFALPILLLTVTPPEISDKAFTAQIRHSSNYQLNRLFPLVPWEASGSSSSFDMQVIPSVVRVELVPTGQSNISQTTLIDMLVILALIGLSWLGWRELKSTNQ